MHQCGILISHYPYYITIWNNESRVRVTIALDSKTTGSSSKQHALQV